MILKKMVVYFKTSEETDKKEQIKDKSEKKEKIEKKSKSNKDEKEKKPNESKKGKKRQSSEPKPKQTPSSYLLFSIDMRKKLKEATPEISVTDCMKAAGEAWRNMNEKDKAVLF